MKKKTGKIIKDASSLGQLCGAIEQICEEKGLEKARVIESIEAALGAAYKKDYGKRGQIIIASLDEKTGEVSFKQIKNVVDETLRDPESVELYKNNLLVEEVRRDWKDIVGEKSREEEALEEDRLPRFNADRDILLEEAKKIDSELEVGDLLEINLEPQEDYGRVASQTAKQVIIQRLREAERDVMYDEFKEKEGEIISGVIQRIEGRTVFIDLGKSIGTLFYSNQSPSDEYQIGKRIKVYVEKVDSDPRCPGVVLSRSHSNLVKKLFELEVPEIFTGTVQIKAISREAGSRSKIAVASKEKGIDPVGSCVGQKGTRVQSVINEVGGEKLDIIEWNDDLKEMVKASLAPAKVYSVELSEDEKEAKVYVLKDQLSMAIGKNGQNVRLASKLINCKISLLEATEDIIKKDKEKIAKEVEIERKKEIKVKKEAKKKERSKEEEKEFQEKEGEINKTLNKEELNF